MTDRKINITKRFRPRRTVVVAVTITAAVFLLVRCMGKKRDAAAGEGDISFSAYAGSAQCISCHKNIYDSHIKTAHYLTGQPATDEFIMGSFQIGKNKFSYSPELEVAMEKRDSGFYQVVYFKGVEKMAMRFDITIGSGVMGQSFLTKRNDRYYQMPITYFTAAGQWSNSPGFPVKKVGIDKIITSRCLECHLTYAQGKGGTEMEPENFDHTKIIFGVDCEKCHGPAARHVAYQKEHPQDTVAKFIVNPFQLTRSQQLDACALCHAGNITKTKPSFTFIPGKNLADHFAVKELENTAVNTGNVDVHGNQFGLLTASKCFTKTSTLTCNTCHNTHENERGKTELFSQRCIGCHNTAAASFATPAHTGTGITAIEKNCIDCHMPAQPSRAIAVFLQGEETPRASPLRTHYISIYPAETQKFKKQQ